MENKIQVIIADDHMLFIDGLKLLLQESPALSIMDVANNGKELLNIMRRKQPDIVLLDINMPGLNGLETAKYIKLSFPLIKAIILSTYNEAHLIEKAKQFGVNGYLLKNSDKQELFQAIQRVADGYTCFPEVRSNRRQNDFTPEDTFLKQFNLTKRELEIIGYIKNRHTNQQIADKLFLSIYTVETHRKNIMQKLGLKTPADLYKFIYEYNL